MLDLKSPEGRAQALALVAGSDVLIENFRPGVMARLGLDAATCHDLNHGLVYCSLPGFSELDERAGLAGWEGVVMAAGGAYCAPGQLVRSSAARPGRGRTFRRSRWRPASRPR